MVYLTGDTHGDFSRLMPDMFPEQSGLTKDDFLIICGDFGGVWNASPEENQTLDRLDALPFTVLFITGNHENFDLLAQYPKLSWHGGQVLQIRSTVLCLLRGYVFELDGHTFFTMGGASSRNLPVLKPDDPLIRLKALWYRIRKQLFWIERVNWWGAELPDETQYQRARENLQAHGNTVDFIVTHCAPDSVQNLLDLREAQAQGSYLPNALTAFLDEIRETCHFRLWFLGHYHGNAAVEEKFLILYDQIIRLAPDQESQSDSVSDGQSDNVSDAPSDGGNTDPSNAVSADASTR